MKTGLLNAQRNCALRIIVLFLIPLLLLVGLNYRQLYSAWLIRSETQRLENLAVDAPAEFQNPAPVEDRFVGGKLSPDFWKFTSINGGGKASHEMSWHSAAISLDSSLVLQHFPDQSFKSEGPDWHAPAADQYNNVTLIGGSGFRPSASKDVVLKFTLRVKEGFYGTAGVIFQPVGTLQKDGLFVKPFDMFGFSIMGKESSIKGARGPICYLALNQMPVQVEPLQVEPRSLHAYEVRLRWISQTEWSGSVKVDDTTQCQITMPPFGPVEVHVWSDNSLVRDRPRRWWEIAPSLDLQYQDGGDKQFSLEMIQILEETR